MKIKLCVLHIWVVFICSFICLSGCDDRNNVTARATSNDESEGREASIVATTSTTVKQSQNNILKTVFLSALSSDIVNEINNTSKYKNVLNVTFEKSDHLFIEIKKILNTSATPFEIGDLHSLRKNDKVNICKLCIMGLIGEIDKKNHIILQKIVKLNNSVMILDALADKAVQTKSKTHEKSVTLKNKAEKLFLLKKISAFKGNDCYEIWDKLIKVLCILVISENHIDRRLKKINKILTLCK